jgi:hypothetical protein
MMFSDCHRNMLFVSNIRQQEMWVMIRPTPGYPRRTGDPGDSRPLAIGGARDEAPLVFPRNLSLRISRVTRL